LYYIAFAIGMSHPPGLGEQYHDLIERDIIDPSHERRCNMATLEERLSSLEGDYTVAIREVAVKLDEHAGLLREHGRDIREIKARLMTMDTRLGAMDARLATVDTRLNSMDEKLDTFREEMNRKFDQVIALLSQAKGG
jgi:chromosome segregation ATPase